MEKKEELLAKHEGEFVLIKGKNLIDIYDSFDEAAKNGLEKFGSTDLFLIRKIEQNPPDLPVSVVYGITNASF